jgi:hypothetical protein
MHQTKSYIYVVCSDRYAVLEKSSKLSNIECICCKTKETQSENKQKQSDIKRQKLNKKQDIIN